MNFTSKSDRNRTENLVVRKIDKTKMENTSIGSENFNFLLFRVILINKRENFYVIERVVKTSLRSIFYES